MGDRAMIVASNGLRAAARALPVDERHRLLELAKAASDARLLRAVVSAGVGGGEWRSTSDAADRAFVVDDRTLRRWLADQNVELPRAVRDRLERLAWAFGVDVRP